MIIGEFHVAIKNNKNHHMKKIIYQLFIILIVSGLFSCKKFLDVPPLHALTPETGITGFSTAQAALGGVYRSFESTAWGGGYWATYSDKAGFTNHTATDYNMTYTQTLGGSVFDWTGFYSSLNAVNYTIEGINKLTESNIKVNEKNKVLGEAKCLRAWINANILWAFGHWWADDNDKFGLLYRDKMVDLSNVQMGRISVGESYAKIYEDLDFAIANLGDFTSSRYVSKQFAEALKAKLLLYRGGYRNTKADLQTALTLVNDVLNNHPAIFAMESNLSDVYKNSWDSKECLFARYLELNSNRGTVEGFYGYSYPYFWGNPIPLAAGQQLTAGLVYGLDWFSSDPRWPLVTGTCVPYTNGQVRFTFTKLARLGQNGGRLVAASDPSAEKYAIYFFRFPELYLMKAELLARTGASIADAIAPINEMRSKRINPVLPALAPASQDELMDMIFKEIVKETYFENGSEFFAATRFQFAGQPMLVTIKGGLVPFVENKLCWPIPDNEMLNNTKMIQNPDED